MAATFDTHEVEASFDRMLRRTPGARVALLVAGQTMLREEAESRTPVDTGLLRDSYQSPPPVGEFVAVTNTCDYALIVHERKAHHDVGEDHFLLHAVTLIGPVWVTLVAQDWLGEVA